MRPGTFWGFDGVTIEGVDYNVTFASGTCADVFGVCDQDHFTFTTTDAARGARLVLDALIFTAFQGMQNPSSHGLWSPAVPALILTPYDINLEVE